MPAATQPLGPAAGKRVRLRSTHRVLCSPSASLCPLTLAAPARNAPAAVAPPLARLRSCRLRRQARLRRAHRALPHVCQDAAVPGRGRRQKVHPQVHPRRAGLLCIQVSALGRVHDSCARACTLTCAPVFVCVFLCVCVCVCVCVRARARARIRRVRACMQASPTRTHPHTRASAHVHLTAKAGVFRRGARAN